MTDRQRCAWIKDDLMARYHDEEWGVPVHDDRKHFEFIVQQECNGFDPYIWQFTGGRTIVNEWQSLKQLPARTAESDAMSKALKSRGFSFVGSTICYSYMQAAGMVNDHVIGCFRHREICRLLPGARGQKQESRR